MQNPEHLTEASLEMQLRGEDMADLYALVHLPLQPSPPYSLRGHLDYTAHKISFRNFSGRVGQSDLEGNLVVDTNRPRPLVTADLRSRQVALADLAGFIGAPPGNASAPTEGVKQKEELAIQAAKPTLLPDTPIDLSKVRSTDYHVRYRADHIRTSWSPLDQIDANLTIDDGNIRLDPLNFKVGTGTIATKIDLDGRMNPLQAKAEIDFRRVDFQRIMATTKIFNGFGTVGGRWMIAAKGNSLAQMLAHGNGNLSLFMGSGDLSAVLVDLAGLDLGSSIPAALGLPEDARINCLVSDFGLINGILNTKVMVLDTDEANVVVKGTVDLRDERMDLQITQNPKHLSIGALHAPIDITGTFKHPSVLPNPKALGVRLGIAAALGAVFPPAALLPTIQLGLGPHQTCGGLVAEANTVGAPAAPSTAAALPGAPPPRAEQLSQHP